MAMLFISYYSLLFFTSELVLSFSQPSNSSNFFVNWTILKRIDLTYPLIQNMCLGRMGIRTADVECAHTASATLIIYPSIYMFGEPMFLRSSSYGI